MTAYPTLSEPLELKWTAALRVGYVPRRSPGTLRLVHLRARLPVDCLEPTSEGAPVLEALVVPLDVWRPVPSGVLYSDVEQACLDSLETVLNRARGWYQAGSHRWLPWESSGAAVTALRRCADLYTREQVARYDDWQAERAKEDRADHLADDAHDYRHA